MLPCGRQATTPFICDESALAEPVRQRGPDGDGGVDVVTRSTEERDQLRHQHEDWLT